MALYHSKGRISDMSEVTSGQSKSGYQWARMTLTLEIPGFQGSVYKQVFQVGTDDINDVLLFSIGDKVDVAFSLYAREWKGKWYNNVDLVKISKVEDQQEQKPAPVQETPQPQIFDNAPESLDPDANPDDLPF